MAIIYQVNNNVICDCVCLYKIYRFVVNIKLSVNKTVPIVVYDDVSSAKELATSFAKIHALDRNAVKVLTGVLQQHIDARKQALLEEQQQLLQQQEQRTGNSDDAVVD